MLNGFSRKIVLWIYPSKLPIYFKRVSFVLSGILKANAFFLNYSIKFCTLWKETDKERERVRKGHVGMLLML